MWLGDWMLGIKVISLRQRWTVNRIFMLLEVDMKVKSRERVSFLICLGLDQI